MHGTHLLHCPRPIRRSTRSEGGEAFEEGCRPKPDWVKIDGNKYLALAVNFVAVYCEGKYIAKILVAGIGVHFYLALGGDGALRPAALWRLPEGCL